MAPAERIELVGSRLELVLGGSTPTERTDGLSPPMEHAGEAAEMAAVEVVVEEERPGGVATRSGEVTARSPLCGMQSTAARLPMLICAPPPHTPGPPITIQVEGPPTPEPAEGPPILVHVDGPPVHAVAYDPPPRERCEQRGSSGLWRSSCGACWSATGDVTDKARASPRLLPMPLGSGWRVG